MVGLERGRNHKMRTMRAASSDQRRNSVGGGGFGDTSDVTLRALAGTSVLMQAIPLPSASVPGQVRLKPSRNPVQLHRSRRLGRGAASPG